MPLWVIRSADGTFLRDRGGESLVAGEADVTITGGALNPRLERYDVTQPTGRRAATGPEIAAYDAAVLVGHSAATSRNKDRLAMCAVIVRERNVSAWNAMTTPQKVAAVFAVADLWATFREFIDDKV